jgi:3-oxoacyl-[acyl-carrier-protein] synthase II
VLFPFPTPPREPHRVVVTGAGIITALGLGWKINAEAFRAGRTAFRAVTLFDVSRQRCKIAAEIDLPQKTPVGRLTQRSQRRLTRGSRMLLHAAFEAWNQSGWQACENLPIVLGTTGCGAEAGESFFRDAVEPNHHNPSRASLPVAYQGQRQGLDLAEALDCSGPLTIISNACASGSNAIGHAWELVRTGQSARALAGGYDALGQLVFGGFDSLQALSQNPCRPFDAARNGLTLGEGAAILALETLPSARQRNAEILGEIIGYGATTDVHHLTQPHPEGEAALAAMQEGCATAKINPADITYANAHGTATIHNDASEAIALRRLRGDCISSLHVSSTKASIGHLLGAAGAVEAVICLMTLRGQWLPPQTCVEQIDPACNFKLVRQASDAPIEIALSNSFGFGGANASLIFRRWS